MCISDSPLPPPFSVVFILSPSLSLYFPPLFFSSSVSLFSFSLYIDSYPSLCVHGNAIYAGSCHVLALPVHFRFSINVPTVLCVGISLIILFLFFAGISATTSWRWSVGKPSEESRHSRICKYRSDRIILSLGEEPFKIQ
jgi:hypothetical protein